MQSFSYYVPTKVEFGKDSEKTVAENIKYFGGSRVFIVYGSDRVLENGLMDKITKSLDENSLPYTMIGGVVANPHLSLCYEAIKKADEFKADFILAVGGGSVIDSAKCIAHGLANIGTDVWDFWLGEKPLTKSTPHGCVLTIAAAGSEMSNSAVITNTETKVKKGINTDFNKPKFACLNPEFTYTLPKYQVACGIVDIMMHTMERYFTVVGGNELTDSIAEALIRNVMKNGKILLKNPTDYESASEIMWAGSLSHNSLTGLGQVADFGVHGLGHELSAKFDLAHGASLSAVWESWARYTYKANPQRFVSFGKNIFGIEESDVEVAVDKTIKEMVAFFKSIDMPTSMSEAKLPIQTEEELKELGLRATYFEKRLVGNFVKLNKDDCTNIYTMMNR